MRYLTKTCPQHDVCLCILSIPDDPFGRGHSCLCFTLAVHSGETLDQWVAPVRNMAASRDNMTKTSPRIADTSACRRGGGSRTTNLVMPT